MGSGLHDALHPAGGWPAELGWWTYLGPERRLPARGRHPRAHSPTAPCWSPALDDPVAVDPLCYENIRSRWLPPA